MLVALPSPTYRLDSSKARPPQKFGHRDLLYEEYYSPRKIYLMIHYYINPKTRDLIFFDSEEEEIIVVPRINRVRVLIGNELQLGDFEPNLNDQTGGTIDGGIHTKSRNKALREKKKRSPWKCPDCDFFTNSMILVGRHKRETEHGQSLSAN